MKRDYSRIQDLWDQGCSYRVIAERMKVSFSTISSVLNMVDDHHPDMQKALEVAEYREER